MQLADLRDDIVLAPAPALGDRRRGQGQLGGAASRRQATEQRSRRAHESTGADVAERFARDPDPAPMVAVQLLDHARARPLAVWRWSLDASFVPCLIDGA